MCVEGELDAKAFEAKMTTADAALAQTRNQLKANMIKSGSIVGINALRGGGIFTKITVIGLIADYQQNFISIFPNLYITNISHCTLLLPEC